MGRYRWHTGVRQMGILTCYLNSTSCPSDCSHLCWGFYMLTACNTVELSYLFHILHLLFVYLLYIYVFIYYVLMYFYIHLSLHVWWRKQDSESTLWFNIIICVHPPAGRACSYLRSSHSINLLLSWWHHLNDAPRSNVLIKASVFMAQRVFWSQPASDSYLRIIYFRSLLFGEVTNTSLKPKSLIIPDNYLEEFVIYIIRLMTYELLWGKDWY